MSMKVYFLHRMLLLLMAAERESTALCKQQLCICGRQIPVCGPRMSTFKVLEYIPEK
jgi:hypothetical protein